MVCHAQFLMPLPTKYKLYHNSYPLFPGVPQNVLPKPIAFAKQEGQDGPGLLT